MSFDVIIQSEITGLEGETSAVRKMHRDLTSL